MKQFFSLALVLYSALAFSQSHDAQTRYNSGFRQFYQWNDVTKAYDLKDTEYESSIIDIREINSSNNGYIVIAMTDDAKTRLYHGSITAFNIEGDDEIWSLRSKILKSKLVYNRKKKTITYSYEATDERYMKIFIFTLSDDD